MFLRKLLFTCATQYTKIQLTQSPFRHSNCCTSGITLDVKHGTFLKETFTVANNPCNNLLFSMHFATFYVGIDTVEIGSQDEAVCFLTYHLIAPPTASLFPTLAGTSPLVPGLRDTFKVWRERLQAGVEAPEFALFLLRNDGYSYYRDKEDDTLLAHIAPLAKIYGFELDIVQVDQCQESIHTIGHAYRDLDALHEDMDVEFATLDMEKGTGFYH